MPPEPLPWDRKELFRDRKHGHSHDRSDSSFGPVARWRDSSSSSYGGSHRNNDFSPRWAFPSDFRRPPGHGKQGGWHMYHEDSGHGYAAARSGDRFLDDDGFRPAIPRGEGRYGRFYRENRASFGQKEWRYHWEPNHHRNILPHTPGRPHFLNDQRSVGDSPMRASHPHSDPSDQFHSKDQADKTSDVNGSGTGQKLERENSLGALDWKPLKWSRSGSLTSRGSGYSHSSGSKSNGGESNDLKGDLSPKNASPLQSPSGDAVACTPSVAPSEEISSRKKPRLGWGEGLAKYEKKKVEGPEENANKVANAAALCSVEPTNTPTSNLVDKSPRLPAFSDCSSPATPSSFACSSSPGMEDKACVKTTDPDPNNCSVSSMPAPENQLEGGLQFSLEKLELNSISNLSSLLNELLQASDQYPMDSAFVKSSALNKLLLWKGEISKELELTETEIDSLENEFKSLNSDSLINGACPASIGSLPADGKDEPRCDISMISRPPPLEVPSPEDMIVDVDDALAAPCDDARGAPSEDKDGDIDSPGTATSKFVESLAVEKSLSAEGSTNGGSKCTNLASSTIPVTQNLDMDTDIEKIGGSSCQDDDDQGACHPKDDNKCDAIINSNKDSAARASEVLSKLLPSCDSCVDLVEANRASCLAADLTIRDKFMRRKHFLKFKEKVTALKYRAFQHLWKEDLRLLSVKSQRMKVQKKNDLSSRTMQGGSQKHRSSIRSRFSSPAGSLSLVPTADLISYTGKLLSESPAKIYRASLKMPAMILDEKEKTMSKFASSNGFVEDPCAIEKERALINPWTVEEKEIFLKQLAIHGKDFSKIASFLDHKTTADCVEFYYKNHKSEWFEKTKKKPELKKQGKPLSGNHYLMTSGNKWSREMNAASLELLGAASVMAAQADEALESSKLLSGKSSFKKSKGSDTIFEASSGYHVEDERETAAADVLAGICGSLSSEAMSSCITSAVDPGEGNQDWKQQKVGSSSRRPLTPEVTQNVDDDTCSDESCGEMDPIDWTDDEKSLFVQAFSSYGKDFVMISRCVRTKSRDQCKVFFSKARKCLDLDNMHPRTGEDAIHANIDANGGGSDADDTCMVETGSVVCSDKSGSRMDEDLTNVNQDVSKPEAVTTELNTVEENYGPGQLGHKDNNNMRQNMGPGDHQADASRLDLDDGVADVQNVKSADTIPKGEDPMVTEDDASKVECSVGVAADIGAVVSADPVAGERTGEKSIVKLESEAMTPSSPIDARVSTDGWCQPSTTGDKSSQSQSGALMIKQGESSQILKSSPLDLPIKVETNSRSFQNCYMRKCSQSPSQNVVAELPFLVKSEVRTDNHAGSSCSSKADKPARNGDVKLFGKILSKPSSADDPTPSAPDGDGTTKHHIASGKFDMNLAINHDMNGNSTFGKPDHNSFLGLENVPIRSYGFWDGTKIQTGFSSLPDSALLLTKYPSAFANYPAAVNVDECNVNGACVFSPREFSNSNGSIVDYPVNLNQEGVQPFSLDLKPRQETLTEVPRHGFEVMSSIRQQGKGMVKLNVVQGGDMLVGSSCTGISDPVTALKFHYARAQQYGGGGGGHGGNGIVREESWRDHGDVRR